MLRVISSPVQLFGVSTNDREQLTGEHTHHCLPTQLWKDLHLMLQNLTHCSSCIINPRSHTPSSGHHRGMQQTS